MELEDLTSMIMNMEPDLNMDVNGDSYYFNRNSLHFITKWMLKDPGTRHVQMERLLHELHELHCLKEEYLRSCWSGTPLETYLPNALAVIDSARRAWGRLLIIPPCVNGNVMFVGHNLITAESFSVVAPGGVPTLGQPQLVAMDTELFRLDVDQTKGGFVVEKLRRKHWNNLGIYGRIHQSLPPKNYHEDYQYDYCHGQKPGGPSPRWP